MAAIVRVKRRRDEEPVDSLLISCKKRKDNDDTQARSTSELTSVLKFAGTVPLQDTRISSHIRDAIRKEKLQREYKTHSGNHGNSESRTVRSRQQHKHESHANRYTVIASHRASLLDRLDSVEEAPDSTPNGNSGENGELLTDGKSKCEDAASSTVPGAQGSSVCDSASGGSEARQDNGSLPSEVSVGGGDGQGAAGQRVFCLYDVEPDAPTQVHNNNVSMDTLGLPQGASSNYSNITCNSVPMVREHVPALQPAPADSEYVYDLYYTNSQQVDFRLLENILTVQAYQDELVFADSRGDEDEYLEVYDDDDDSNDEGNWRNDYPDEDPHFYENQDLEYYYGDDAVGNRRFDTEDPLSTLMMTNCNVGDGQQYQGSYDPLRGPHQSYEAYYSRMMQEFVDDEDDDSDNADDVR